MQSEVKIKYPVGIQSFPEIREGGYLYVDKTEYIHRLFDGKYYFLSRPRRFGKSLFLSTMEAYYQGRRDLFKGLALERLTDNWEPRPVLHLDFNNREYRDRESLVKELSSHFERWEALYGDKKRDRDPEERFEYIIEQAYLATGKKVVILIDEYDKPILNAVERPEVAEEFRSLLKAVYANLKTMDPYIEIAMLTGVARFSKVSVFSDLNNLRDISFENEFAGICGITSDELSGYFGQGMSTLAKSEGETPESMEGILKRRYDGYHFAKKSPDVYNPFSLMNVFAKNDLGDYWFESGTPSYLVKLIRRQGYPLKDLVPVMIEARQLEGAGLLSEDPVPQLYQTGYLTIKHYDPEYRMYTLDYPNEEVKQGFLNCLLASYLPQMKAQSGIALSDFIADVKLGRIDNMMRRLDSMLASMPYSDKGNPESRFQDAIYLLFTLLGFFARMELRTSDGRIDLVVETSDKIYIFEFKIDSTAESAMEQILRKEYWLPYEFSGKEIFLIGANFDSKTRRLSDYLIQTKP